MVGLASDPVFQEHTDRGYHPECPERLAAILSTLEERGLTELLEPLPRREATPEEIERVHASRHVERVLSVRGRWGHLDPDTFFGPASTEAALVAAGAGLQAVEEVIHGRMDSVFCAVRPPGHHAEVDRGMGFCLFNNIALAAAHALEMGLERVLIWDWDAHHGNGTQHAFEEDPRVLFISAHQYPFYPGTGHFTEVGRGPGEGFTCNLSMPRGMKDADYLACWEALCEPLARAFDPQLVLVSAGFDALDTDVLCSMRMSPEGFAHLTDQVLALDRPTVALLEGGYDIEGQALSVARVVERMLVRSGQRPHEPLQAVAQEQHPASDELIAAVREQLRPMWGGAL